MRASNAESVTSFSILGSAHKFTFMSLPGRGSAQKAISCIHNAESHEPDLAVQTNTL